MSKSDKRHISIPKKEKEPDPGKELGGSYDQSFNLLIASQAASALNLAHADKKTQDVLVQSAMTALQGIAPRDEMEGMLAAQMVACHHAAMECYRRAMLENQTFEGRQMALNLAGKLSRTYTNMLEALNRKRGKRQQKVTVRHVHVNEGGQAIVGNVSAGDGKERGER